MTDKDLSVNQENEFDEISIEQEDESFQYTIVPNNLIRDISISPQCRWLIIFLLSNKPGWKIKTRQLCEHTKGFMGRDVIRNALNEAIAAGYISRDVILRETEKGKLRGYSYRVASTPKFKKSLRQPGFQGPDDQAPENQGTKELLSQELLSIRNNTSSLKVPEEPVAIAPEGDVSKPPDKPKRTRAPSAFSAKVKEVADRMINILTEKNPVYRPPSDLTKFLTHVQYLVEKDKQDVEILITTFEWAAADNEERSGFKGWQGVICSVNPAETFRKHFAKIHSQMNSQPKRKFAPSSNDARSLEKWKEAAKDAI